MLGWRFAMASRLLMASIWALELLTLIGKNDKERRVMINTGAALGWQPSLVYHRRWRYFRRVAYDLRHCVFWVLPRAGLTLIALWMRPIGFDYRSKLQPAEESVGLGAICWRPSALIFGVAFGNLLLGVPFEMDSTLKSTYTGSFFGLLTPFALVAGLLSGYVAEPRCNLATNENRWLY